MIKRRALSLFLLFVLFLVGCDKADINYSTPSENFEALWKIMDEHYCFFEYKNLDWDKVYDRYEAKISDTMNRYALFDTLALMLSELKDGHTNLVSTFNYSRYWNWYEDYPSNYNAEIVDRNYLGTDYKIAGGMKYKIMGEGQVGYVYYGSFASGVGDNNLDEILFYFKDCKGLILDLRNNSGGSLAFSDRIASRFLEKESLVGYIQHKTGNGHADFSEPYPLYLQPSERIRWLRPVILLTNRRCYSATNNFVSKMCALPQVTTLGDSTGGGSGLPFSSEIPNGWSVRFSASPLLDANKEHTEFGIAPKIKLDMLKSDMLKGKDTLIDRAIDILLKQDKN